jgi:hypothetical protein
MDWTVKDQILWIESLPPGEPYTPTPWERDIWLAHYRYRQSYSEIARQHYPSYWNLGLGKRQNQRGISLVRRVIDGVDRYLAEVGRRNQQRPRDWQFSGGCGFCDID